VSVGLPLPNNLHGLLHQIQPIGNSWYKMLLLDANRHLSRFMMADELLRL
jgi:hypothetical protein